MFSKGSKTPTTPAAPKPATAPKPAATPSSSAPAPAAAAPKPKAAASILSTDLMIKGNVKSSGDIQILGQIEGDVRAHLLTVGEGALVKGEVIADDVVINGKVAGRVRGLKVRLTSTAVVEGDIIHKTIAIESGAHFEGSVQRQEDPMSKTPAKSQAASAAATRAKASE